MAICEKARTVLSIIQKLSVNKYGIEISNIDLAKKASTNTTDLKKFLNQLEEYRLIRRLRIKNKRFIYLTSKSLNKDSSYV